MSDVWLSVPQVAEIVSISRRAALKAAITCAAGQLWRGTLLTVRSTRGRGGRSGLRYEIALNSLPEPFQEPLSASSTALTCNRQPDACIPAPNQSDRVRHRWTVIEAAALAAPRSPDRAEAIRDAAERHKVPVRTIQRWITDLEAAGGDVNALARRKPADAGKKRVAVSRAFDKAFLKAGYDPAILPEIAALVDGETRAGWASKLQRAGFEAVRRYVVSMLRKDMEARGLPLPKAAFVLSERRIKETSNYRVVDVRANDRKRYDDAKPRIRRDNTLFAPMQQVVMDVKPLDNIVTRPDGSTTWPKMIGFLDTGMRVMAMQGGQLATAIDMMGVKGAGGRAAAFFAGPWGAVILTATAILGPMVAKLWETSDAADKASKTGLALVDALSRQKYATDAGREAIKAYNDAQEQQRKGGQLAREESLKNAAASLQSALAVRRETQELLARAKAQAAIAYGAQPGDEGGIAVGATAAGLGVAAIQRQLDAGQKAIEELQKAARNLTFEQAVKSAKAAVDPIEAMNQEYERQVELLRKAAIGSDKLTASLADRLIVLNKTHKAEVDTEQERQRRANATPRSTSLGNQIEAGSAAAIFASAERYRGLSENRTGERAQLSDLFRQAGANVDPKMTAWCAAFVNAVLATNGIKGSGTTSYDTAEEAQAAALANAIADGAVKGLSDRVSKAIRSSTDVTKAVAEAAKVQNLELTMGGITATIDKAFREFEATAKERVRIAGQYGFDLVAIEKRNGEDRAKLAADLAAQQVGSLSKLIEEMTSGSLSEGTAIDRIDAINTAIGKAKKDMDAGVEGAGDTLADLYQRRLAASKEAYGTTSGYAADRTATLDEARAAVAAANARIVAAQGAKASDPALKTTNATLDEIADLTTRLNATQQTTNELIAKLWSGGGSSSFDLRKLASY